jgi:hypothetical protein
MSENPSTLARCERKVLLTIITNTNLPEPFGHVQLRKELGFASKSMYYVLNVRNIILDSSSNIIHITQIHTKPQLLARPRLGRDYNGARPIP